MKNSCPKTKMLFIFLFSLGVLFWTHIWKAALTKIRFIINYNLHFDNTICILIYFFVFTIIVGTDDVRYRNKELHICCICIMHTKLELCSFQSHREDVLRCCTVDIRSLNTPKWQVKKKIMSKICSTLNVKLESMQIMGKTIRNNNLDG